MRSKQQPVELFPGPFHQSVPPEDPLLKTDDSLSVRGLRLALKQIEQNGKQEGFERVVMPSLLHLSTFDRPAKQINHHNFPFRDYEIAPWLY